MRRWNYGINSLYKTANLWLEDGPAWSFWLEDNMQRLCSVVPLWLGHHWFHLRVCDPLVRWSWSKRTQNNVKIPFETVREMFYERDKAFWEDEASI